MEEEFGSPRKRARTVRSDVESLKAEIECKKSMAPVMLVLSLPISGGVPLTVQAAAALLEAG